MLIKEKYENHKREVNERFDNLKKNEEELETFYYQLMQQSEQQEGEFS